jgi:NAD(P)-dependent dehydrogenase (short-subunit alcohol dehydrogenase family)
VVVIFLFILILERNLVHYRRLLMSKRILVLGATGPTGLAVVREALSRGHIVVAYVRTPSKIPSELAANKNLNVCTI